MFQSVNLLILLFSVVVRMPTISLQMTNRTKLLPSFFQLSRLMLRNYICSIRFNLFTLLFDWILSYE